MFDRLPTPYGLVRAGVAPDHQKIKAVTAAFDKIAAHPRFRFFGGVELGKHVNVADLRAHYHQIVYTTGAQTDRRMGIDGEDLPGSHPATEFVAWYNGHPDYRDLQFDLTQERVAVVGVGNVAIDVARILSRTPEELEKTDIAEHALEALRASRVREVYLLGRRGPAQAAFTNPEIKELGELAAADVVVKPEEVELDELSRASLEKSGDRAGLEEGRDPPELRAAPGRHPAAAARHPLPRLAGGAARARRRRRRHPARAQPPRRLGDRHHPGARPTDQFEELPVGLVFRSVGYRGVPLPGVPFDDKWGVVLNEKGRVLDPDTKRGAARGVHGGLDQARAHAASSAPTSPTRPRRCKRWPTTSPPATRWHRRSQTPTTLERLVHQRQPQYVSYADWLKLNEVELARGRARGRPRLKFTRVDEMLAALGNRGPR